MRRELYERTATAGRLVMKVRYSRPLPGDSKAARAAKMNTTTRAQRYINCRNSSERVQGLLAANFDNQYAYFCTMTFAPQNLPDSRTAAQKAVTTYIRVMRKERKKQGRELKYIYSIEGEPIADPSGGGAFDEWETAPWNAGERWELLGVTQASETPPPPVRFHVHIFLLLETKADMEAVHALWRHGQVYAEKMDTTDVRTFPRLAAYITKDMRNGITPNGARSYSTSTNLDKPVITGRWVCESEPFTATEGAQTVYEQKEVTMYSSFQYLLYRLPEPHRGPGTAPKIDPSGRVAAQI